MHFETKSFNSTHFGTTQDASFLLDSSEKILPLLLDSNLLVALNASWALGNLADTLDKDQYVSYFFTCLN